MLWKYIVKYNLKLRGNKRGNLEATKEVTWRQQICSFYDKYCEYQGQTK